MARNKANKGILKLFAKSDANTNRTRVFELFFQMDIAHKGGVTTTFNHI